MNILYNQLSTTVNTDIEIDYSFIDYDYSCDSEETTNKQDEITQLEDE